MSNNIKKNFNYTFKIKIYTIVIPKKNHSILSKESKYISYEIFEYVLFIYYLQLIAFLLDFIFFLNI